MRVDVGQYPWRDQHLILKLVRRVQKILKAYQKFRAVTAGLEVEAFLASDPLW